MATNEKTVVGVDLGGTKVAAGRVRRNGLEAVATRMVPAAKPAEEVLDVVIGCVGEVCQSDVSAIGVGAPSVVDVAEGIVREVGNIPSWKAVPLQAELERHFHVSAVIDNDANAFAMGELVFGAGAGCHHLVGLTLGTGLGAGVVIGGRLLHGANCGVGELGKTDRKGMRLEDWCASPYFQRQWGSSGEELHRRARAGDADARAAWQSYGDELSVAVMRTLYAYDPELIVFGGSLSRAFDLFEDAMRRGFTAFAYPHVVERVRIVPTRLEHAAVLGAAALALNADSAPAPRRQE